MSNKNLYNNNELYSDTETCDKKPTNRSIILNIFYILIIFTAIYLSTKCSGNYWVLHGILAFLCPILYIIYAIIIWGKCPANLPVNIPKV